MTRTAEQIQQDIDSLSSELIEIKKKSDDLIDQKASIERQERELKNRLQKINGYRSMGVNTIGLIEQLELELKESNYPHYDKARRIVKVTDKAIYLKIDGFIFGDEQGYSKETGWRARARSDLDAIDAKKALEIWERHHAL